MLYTRFVLLSVEYESYLPALHNVPHPPPTIYLLGENEATLFPTCCLPLLTGIFFAGTLWAYRANQELSSWDLLYQRL